MLGTFIFSSFFLTLIYTNSGLNAFQTESQQDLKSIPSNGDDPLPKANVYNDKEDIEPVAADSMLVERTQDGGKDSQTPDNLKRTEPESKVEFKQQMIQGIDSIPLEVDAESDNRNITQTEFQLVVKGFQTSIIPPLIKSDKSNALTTQISSDSSVNSDPTESALIRQEITNETPRTPDKPPYQTKESKAPEPLINHQRTECKVPKLDPFDLEVLRFHSSSATTTQCHGKGFVKLEDKYLYIDDDKEGLIDRAEYRIISTTGDEATQFTLGTPITLLPGKSHGHHVKHDFIQVDILYKGKTHLEFFLQAITKPLPSLPSVSQSSLVGVDGKPLNVIVLLVTSATHAHFQRKLSKVYNHLKNDVNSAVFDKYINSGAGMHSSLEAILYGGSKNKDKVNIFQSFKKKGYITMYSDDSSSSNALLLHKDVSSSIDHFAQPFWQAANKHYGEEHCLYNPSKYALQLNLISSLYQTYPNTPIFAVMALSEFQYDGNSLENLEQPLLDFFTLFDGKGYSMDTVFILAGDNGEMTQSSAALMTQIKLESKLPFLSITYPRFTSSFDLYENFYSKRTRLVTPLDLHVTLNHLLNYPQNTQLSLPAISLFGNEYPLFRTCESAGIDSKQCPCYLATTEDPDSDIVRTFSRALIGHINHMLYTFLRLPVDCVQISLKRIVSVEKLVINPSLQSFGFAAIEQHKFPALYDISLDISPHGGRYAAKMKANGGRISLRGIARILKTGEELDCYDVTDIEKAKLCFCKK